jgi:hypothetical protein
VTATASCPAGKVLFGGGAIVSTDNGAHRGFVAVQSSYPSGSTWTAIGTVLTSTLNPLPLGSGHSMKVTAYAICSN